MPTGYFSIFESFFPTPLWTLRLSSIASRTLRAPRGATRISWNAGERSLACFPPPMVLPRGKGSVPDFGSITRHNGTPLAFASASDAATLTA